MRHPYNVYFGPCQVPTAHSYLVPGAELVKIRARCDACGRRISPHDTIVTKEAIILICSGCHADLFEIELAP